MKTLVTKDSAISKYVLQDDVVVVMHPDRVVVGDPFMYVIGDCNSNNVVLHFNVTPPEDWVGNKYLFDSGSWTPNPDFISA